MISTESPATHLRIALFVPENAGGGLELRMTKLGKGLLERGVQVDLLCLSNHMPISASNRQSGIRIVSLDKDKGLFKNIRSRLLPLRAEPRLLPCLWRSLVLDWKFPASMKYMDGLIDYLDTSRPAVLIPGWVECSILACWANKLARTPTRLIINECISLSSFMATMNKIPMSRYFWRALPDMVRLTYRQADAITTVSDGVADDLANITDLDRNCIESIYNPIVDDNLLIQACEPVTCPWFTTGQPPVILSAGRLHPQKDYPTLLKAFALLRRHRDARLIILGEGQEHNHLKQLARDLAVDKDVSFPGWVANPFAYMANAAIFVLSSHYEGFGNVIAEALACGCPVVSTDCPSGPSEILNGGRYGKLVPVGEYQALANAMLSTLDNPPDRDMLRRRGMFFSVDRAVDQYLNLFQRINTSRITNN